MYTVYTTKEVRVGQRDQPQNYKKYIYITPIIAILVSVFLYSDCIFFDIERLDRMNDTLYNNTE